MNNSNVTDDCIYRYTRKQAIEDGEQMLLTGEQGKLARQAGYKWPVYVTNSVLGIIEKAAKGKSDFNGVLWDILYISIHMNKQLSNSLVKFRVMINGRYREFFMQAGATDFDDPRPCLTLMTHIDL